MCVCGGGGGGRGVVVCGVHVVLNVLSSSSTVKPVKIDKTKVLMEN